MGLRDKLKCRDCNMTQHIFDRLKKSRPKHKRMSGSFFNIEKLYGFEQRFPAFGISAPKLTKMLQSFETKEYNRVFKEDPLESGTGKLILNWETGFANALLFVDLCCKECAHEGEFILYEDEQPPF